MEIKILHSIIHSELMPWALEKPAQLIQNDALKKALRSKPNTLTEITSQQKTLLSFFPAISAWLNQQKVAEIVLQDLPFETDLLKHTNAVSKFYSLVISNECKRLYNLFIETTKNKKNTIDLNFHTSELLKKIKVLLLHLNKELQSKQLDNTSFISFDLISFVLQYLKQALIVFYFSIQEVYKPVLDEVIDLENFFLIELRETIDKIIPIRQVSNIAVIPIVKKNSETDFSFGFIGDIKKLKTVIAELCREIELLDESRSQQEDLFKVFIAKNIKPGSSKIYIGCQTKQFRYILDQLTNYFNHLTLSNIEKSLFFYSKRGTLITENNLATAASKGKIHPLKKVNIDKIFKHL